jgi:CHAT domain-containing protein/Flp pilus assembly protein TadD
MSNGTRFHGPWGIGVVYYTFVMASSLPGQGTGLFGNQAELQRARDLTAAFTKQYEQGRYDEAVKTAEEVRDIRRRILGEDHLDYAETLNNLGTIYRRIGAYDRAIPILRQSLEIVRRRHGTNNRYYATALYNLAYTYDNAGQYAQAETFYLQAAEVFKQGPGKHETSRALCLGNLAELNRKLGRFAKALELARQTLEIRGQIVGTSHADYATALGCLADVYHSMGELARAEPLYRQSLAMTLETRGDEHPYYASTLSDLAGLYFEMGDYHRAEPLYNQSIEIVRQVFGEQHPEYATALNNLAMLCKTMRNFERAESLYLEAESIGKRNGREQHPTFAVILNNLGDLYYTMKAYDKAEPRYVRAAEILKKAYGENHPDYAATMQHLAVLYKRLGDFERALPRSQQALAIRRRTVSPKHLDLAESLNQVASLYSLMGRTVEAEPLFREALTISRESLQATATIQTERQQLIARRNLRHHLDDYVSLGVRANDYAPQVFEEVLRWKGAALMRQRALRLAASDPAAADLPDRLRKAVSALASHNRAEPKAVELQAAWRERLSELTLQREFLEAELSSKSVLFRSAAKEVTLAEVLAALPRGDVLVDYCEFDQQPSPREKSGPTAKERRLVAFIVRHADRLQDRVTLVPLGPLATIEAAIDEWRGKLKTGADQALLGRQLRAALWEPLVAGIGDADTVLVSVEGAMARFPLGALPGRKTGSYLIEDHRLAMLPAPQLLVALGADRSDRTLPPSVLLLGDVDYDAHPGPGFGHPSIRDDAAGEPPFPSLSGTKKEIAAIAELFRKSPTTAVGKVSILASTAAMESQFREVARQSSFLHLATHGYFEPAKYRSALNWKAPPGRVLNAPELDPAAPVDAFYPGLLAGIAFTGANRTPGDLGDDGVLTADEIACLSLDGVRLVTLSACETGLGQKADGEGLMSLQRAFHVAGARTTVASLWKVNDELTAALMERFYQNIISARMNTTNPRTSMLDSLRDAQLWALRNPKEFADAARARGADAPPASTLSNESRSSATNPRYWAAFFLSGDWR